MLPAVARLSPESESNQQENSSQHYWQRSQKSLSPASSCHCPPIRGSCGARGLNLGHCKVQNRSKDPIVMRHYLLMKKIISSIKEHHLQALYRSLQMITDKPGHLLEEDAYFSQKLWLKRYNMQDFCIKCH